MQRVEEIGIIELDMVLLTMKFQAEKEQSCVHHLQLRLVVTEAKEAFSIDSFLQMAAIDFFRLSLELRLALLVEEFFLRKRSVLIIINLTLKIILIKVEHQSVKIASIENILSVCCELTTLAALSFLADIIKLLFQFLVDRTFHPQHFTFVDPGTHANFTENTLDVKVDEEVLADLTIAFAKVTVHLIGGIGIIQKLLSLPTIRALVNILEEDGLNGRRLLEVRLLMAE